MNKENYIHGLKLIFKYVKKVLPKVDMEIDHCANICEDADDTLLGEQAVSSLYQKKFHSQGGCVFALYPKVNLSNSVKFIVSLQTISDYLDNLCDRVGTQNEKSLRQLHLSMLDAVDPFCELNDYYKYYPYKNDNNYLISLVTECRNQIIKLPSYNRVINRLKKYIGLYSEMQVFKHLSLEVRESKLQHWANKYLHQYPGLTPWEFSAASGSTLCVFVLYSIASDPFLTEEVISNVEDAYFPWICSLHILLDYFIDAQEDICTGDLNFTSYYTNLKQCEMRLSFYIEKSFDQCKNLPNRKFHETVIRGLLAMYLSDPKASVGLNKLTSRNLLAIGGFQTKLYYILCKFLRHVNVI